MTDKLHLTDEAPLDVPPCRPLRTLVIMSVLGVLSAIGAALLSWISG